MKLDPSHQQHVIQWIEQGLKLSEIQKRLETELGIRLTYLDARLLVDDLKVMPKDPPEKKEESKPEPPPSAPPGNAYPDDAADEDTDAPLPSAGKVRVTVDALTRPGAAISGKVTFSDGQTGEWYLDQYGRLGVAPAQQGYRPSQEDVREFQAALQKELQGMGF